MTCSIATHAVHEHPARSRASALLPVLQKLQSLGMGGVRIHEARSGADAAPLALRAPQEGRPKVRTASDSLFPRHHDEYAFDLPST